MFENFKKGFGAAFGVMMGYGTGGVLLYHLYKKCCKKSDENEEQELN